MKCGFVGTELVEDSFISGLTPWVRSIARKLASGLAPGSYELQDLISAGFLGVLEARERYDESQNVPFKKYAYLRVRGAIIDQIRKECFLSVAAGKYAERCREAERGESHSFEEDELLQRKAKDNALAFRVEYFEDGLAIEGLPCLEEQIDNARKLTRIAQSMNKLKPREQNVIIDYYSNALTFEEIGSTLNTTRSNVSKIHKKALRKIKQEVFKEAA